jgi:Integrase core domain
MIWSKHLVGGGHTYLRSWEGWLCRCAVQDATTPFAESYFVTLKKELVRRRSWPSREELTCEVSDYIEIFCQRDPPAVYARHASPTRHEEENRSLEQLNNINAN